MPEMPSGAENRRSIRQGALFFTASACMFLFGMILLLMGSLLPSLAVSTVQAGSLGSFPLAGILVATALIGPVLDTLGTRPALAVALALVAGSLALMPECHSYPELAAAALAYGLGGGVLNTATNALVADLRPEGRSAALNRLGFSFSLGALAAPLLMSWASRTQHPALGTAGQATAIPDAFLLRLMALLTAAILIPVVILRFPAPTRRGATLNSLLGVLENPSVWLFGVLLFFESGAENCMFVWTGKMAAGLFALAPREALLILGGLTAAMGVGRLFASQYLRILGSRKTLLGSAAVVATGTAVTYASRHVASGLLGLMIIGFGMSAIFPTALGVAGDRFPRETGTVFGAIMTLALIGGTAAPVLGGWLALRGMLNILWVPIISSVAVGGLSWVVTRAEG